MPGRIYNQEKDIGRLVESLLYKQFVIVIILYLLNSEGAIPVMDLKILLK